MSIFWSPPFSRPQTRAPRGAAPVGTLADLPLLEQGAVLLMRQWCQDEDGRIAVAQDFTRALGEDGAQAVNLLAHLITLIVRYGRRPMMRHDLTCTCIGGDESAFAQMVAAAAAGDRDDAMAFALTMMPAEIAFEAVQTAGPLGLWIHAMARHMNPSERPTFPVPPQSRRH